MRNRLSRALPVADAVLAAVTIGLPVSAATAAESVPLSHAAPADHATYVVTVHPGLDPAAVADAYGITPLHVPQDAQRLRRPPLPRAGSPATHRPYALLKVMRINSSVDRGGRGDRGGR